MLLTLQFQIIGRGRRGGVLIKKRGGGPTDNLNIKQRGRGSEKMFLVKSGNPFSVIMGVPNNYL